MSRHEDLHEYVTFEDPGEYRTWVFDVTFLTSNWTCIFGRGCHGVLDEPAPELGHGCCSHGAYFVDDEDHADALAHIERLTPEQWQFHGRAQRNGPTRAIAGGGRMTRVHDGACIMLNRPGFAGGAGCALHIAAESAGERPVDWKPDVCWQLPLRLDESTDDNGHVTSILREWKRRDWGEGGADFAWWCIEDGDAFIGTRPVYAALEDEIVEMIGREPYDLFVEHITTRQQWQPVPHPALRTRR